MRLLNRPDNTDLQPGEWRLYCARCGYQAEKNTAQSSTCPDCKAHLWMASEQRKSVAEIPPATEVFEE